MSRFSLPRRDFAIVFMVLLTVAAGNTALQSVLPAIGRSLRIPDLLIAMIFSLSALIWTASAPAWARASDLRGRKRLMQVGLAGFTVSMVLCGVVIHGGIEGWIGPLLTVALFALARCLFGLFGSASNPAAQAYVAGRTSIAARTTALATLASAFGLGTILGPAVAPLFVVRPFGLAGPLFAFAAIGAATLLLLSRLLHRDAPDDASAGGAAASMPTIGGGSTGATVTAALAGTDRRLSWRDRRILPYTLFGLLAGSAQAATGQSMGFLVIDRVGGDAIAAQPLIGLAFMAGAGATLLVQWGLIRMVGLAPAGLMRWGAALAAAGLVATAMAPDYHATVLAYALTSAGYGFIRPASTAGASLAVGPEEQGGVAGAVTAVNGSAFIAAPAIGVGLYELGQPLPYLASALVMLGLLFWAVTSRRLRADG